MRPCSTEATASSIRWHGYPPDRQEKATRTVLEHAELLSAAWGVEPPIEGESFVSEYAMRPDHADGLLAAAERAEDPR